MNEDPLFLLSLPAEMVEQIVELAAARVCERVAARSPWLTRLEAADYLRVPLSRLEKDRSLPAHRWDGRVLYNRDELDRWLLEKTGGDG